jgi:hypothetical protein
VAAPRAIWIIVAGATPTSFRSRYREDLVPTLHQLQRKQSDVRLLWFEHNRFWESQEQAEAALLAERARTPGRGRDWRPGGEHKDPRAKYKITRDEKRKRFKQRLIRGPKPDGPGAKPNGPGAKPGRPPETSWAKRPPRSGPRPDRRDDRRDGPRSDRRDDRRDGPRHGPGQDRRDSPRPDRKDGPRPWQKDNRRPPQGRKDGRPPWRKDDRPQGRQDGPRHGPTSKERRPAQRRDEGRPDRRPDQRRPEDRQPGRRPDERRPPGGGGGFGGKRPFRPKGSGPGRPKPGGRKK